LTKIVVPDDEPPVFTATAEEKRLRQLGEVVIHNSRALSDDELLKRIADADVALNIRSTSVFTANVMENSPKLKLISIYGVGYDNVDISAAAKLNITVTNTPAYSAISVSEMALALMLAVARKIVQNDRTIRSGEWARGYASQLCGKTLGVIGTGSIGQRMIQLGKAIGTGNVGLLLDAWHLYTSGGTLEDLDEITADDVVTLGIRVAISWDAGIELVSPMPERESFVTEYLEERGEGLMGVVFAVDDVEAARHAAQALGVGV